MAQIKDLGLKAGVVLNPGTSLTTIEEVRGPLALDPLSTAPSDKLTALLSCNPGSRHGACCVHSMARVAPLGAVLMWGARCH